MENNSKMSDIIIRKVACEDIEPLASLYDEVWPNDNVSHLKKANFVLKESNGVSYCAEKDGKIVGSRTSFFIPVYYGDRKINCVQFADSCIHESCRRQGLFLRMNQAFLHDFFEEKGGELVFNISVDASRSAYEKLGWKYINSLASFTRIIRPFHAMKMVGFKVKKFHGQMTISENGNEIVIDDKLFAIREGFMKSNGLIHVNYDAKVLSWKLNASSGVRCISDPHKGAVIYKVAQKESGLKVVLLGDMFLYEYDTRNIRSLEQLLCNREKADLMMGSFAKGHPLYKYYINKGLLNRFITLNHGVKVVNEEMRTICLNPDNWAISAMDIDIF